MSEVKKEVVIKFPSTKEYLQRHREKIEGFRQTHDKKRTIIDRVADEIAVLSGSFLFFIFHIAFFAVWILININVFSTIAPFDPYPFGLLTMIVSLEAIFLSIIVLLSQNRQAKIADLREELDLQINRIAEKEITKLIQMQVIMMKHLGITIEGDEELERMMKEIDTQHIQKQLEKEEKPSSGMLQSLPIFTAPTPKAINNVIKKIGKFLDRPIESVL